ERYRAAPVALVDISPDDRDQHRHDEDAGNRKPAPDQDAPPAAGVAGRGGWRNRTVGCQPQRHVIARSMLAASVISIAERAVTIAPLTRDSPYASSEAGSPSIAQQVYRIAPRARIPRNPEAAPRLEEQRFEIFRSRAAQSHSAERRVQPKNMSCTDFRCR